jgi:hypothetical protein
MRTAPVPRVIPVDSGLRAIDTSRRRVRLSAPSRGSVGTSAGKPASSDVPRVTRTFSNHEWLRFSSAMCDFTLLPGGEPEFPLGQC